MFYCFAYITIINTIIRTTIRNLRVYKHVPVSIICHQRIIKQFNWVSLFKNVRKKTTIICKVLKNWGYRIEQVCPSLSIRNKRSADSWSTVHICSVEQWRGLKLFMLCRDEQEICSYAQLSGTLAFSNIKKMCETLFDPRNCRKLRLSGLMSHIDFDCFYIRKYYSL